LNNIGKKARNRVWHRTAWQSCTTVKKTGWGSWTEAWVLYDNEENWGESIGGSGATVHAETTHHSHKQLISQSLSSPFTQHDRICSVLKRDGISKIISSISARLNRRCGSERMTDFFRTDWWDEFAEIAKKSLMILIKSLVEGPDYWNRAQDIWREWQIGSWKELPEWMSPFDIPAIEECPKSDPAIVWNQIQPDGKGGFPKRKDRIVEKIGNATWS
jgi:hypothetical protein